MTKAVTTIWLDQTKICDRQCHISFCTIDPYLITYRDAQKCIDYITNLKDDEGRVVMIISTSEQLSASDTLIQQYVKLIQVESIYILCNSTEMNIGICDKPSKVRGIYTERYSLCKEFTLLPYIKHQRREDFQRTDFIITALEKLSDTYTTSTTSSPQCQQSFNTSTTEKHIHVLEFLYLKILQDLLLENLNSTRSEMITFCRQKYVGNPVELNRVEEFEEYYTSENAIFWYTRDIFLYRLLNQAFRNRDIKTIYSLRYFIKDLYLRLKQLHNSQSSFSREYTVYRGQLMDNAEFDTKIRNNIDGFFSINSFLSTTQERYLALFYSGSSGFNRTSKEQCVLFEIPIDISINGFSYADISNESVFGQDEKEVLFNIGVIFRIISIIRNSNEHVWIVKLKLSNEEDTHLHKIKPTIKNDITKPYKPLIKLIRLLCRMQYLEEAEYFSLLALEDKSITSDIDLLSLVHYQLGIIYKSTGKIKEAIAYFKLALDTKWVNDTSYKNPALSNLYTNLGTVYEDNDELDSAYTYHNLALEVFLDAEIVNQANLAMKYSNIASICRKKEYYLQALENYTNCLKIELEIFSSNDIRLFITKNNIGVVYIHLENYTKAIEHFQEIIEISTNLCDDPSINIHLAINYWNLACDFYQQRKLEEALNYLRECENIVSHKLHIVYHSLQVTHCKNWIQRIEGEISTESHQILKGYGPDPWSICHPYSINSMLE